MPVPVVVALERAERPRAPSSLDVVVVVVVSVSISMLMIPVLLSLGLVPDAADLVADGVPDVVYAPQYGHDEVLSHITIVSLVYRSLRIWLFLGGMMRCEIITGASGHFIPAPSHFLTASKMEYPSLASTPSRDLPIPSPRSR